MDLGTAFKPDICPRCGKDSGWALPVHQEAGECLGCIAIRRREQKAEDWVEETWGTTTLITQKNG